MKRYLIVALLAVVAAAGCQARKDYPEPKLGYHSPGFNVVFGRLQRLPAADPDAPPVWVVRFGDGAEMYQGELALTDLKAMPEFTKGYAGGEPVEIHGHVYDQPSKDAFDGRWYVVESIQLWSGYRQ